VLVLQKNNQKTDRLRSTPQSAIPRIFQIARPHYACPREATISRCRRIFCGRQQLVMFVCLIAWPANALDYTAGDATNCGTRLQERSKLEPFIHQGGQMPTGIPGQWPIGFLEGWTWGCMHHKPHMDGLDSQAIFERVDNVCRANTGATPLHLVAADLIRELDPGTGGMCPPPDPGYAHTAASR
jgi:hypothetical protein